MAYLTSMKSTHESIPFKHSVGILNSIGGVNMGEYNHTQSSIHAVP